MSSLSDSTLTAMDLVVAQSGGAALSVFSGRAIFTVDGNSAEVNAVGTTSAAAGFDNATAYATVGSGIVTFAGQLSAVFKAPLQQLWKLLTPSPTTTVVLVQLPTRGRRRRLPVHARWI